MRVKNVLIKHQHDALHVVLEYGTPSTTRTCTRAAGFIQYRTLPCSSISSSAEPLPTCLPASFFQAGHGVDFKSFTEPRLAS